MTARIGRDAMPARKHAYDAVPAAPVEAGCVGEEKWRVLAGPVPHGQVLAVDGNEVQLRRLHKSIFPWRERNPLTSIVSKRAGLWVPPRRFTPVRPALRGRQHPAVSAIGFRAGPVQTTIARSSAATLRICLTTPGLFG